jgi:hypothetical protein
VRGVRHTQTYFVLEEVKSTHAVRVRLSEAGRAAASAPKRRRVRS